MTSRHVDADRARLALSSRLAVAHGALLPEQSRPSSGDPSRDAAILLDDLVREVRDRGNDTAALWLLFVAVAAGFPTTDELVDLRRTFELDSPVECSVAVLRAGFAVTAAYGSPESEMRLITESVLVDVDFTAQHELHTGIQRVVRSTVPAWAADRDITFAAWTAGCGAYRELRQSEIDRVANWGDARTKPRSRQRQDTPMLLVPWGAAVVLAEVPDRSACAKLSAIGRYTPSEVTAIGYDCIPIVSADLLAPVEPNRFVHYLSAMKYAHGIAGISASAAAEFAGFAAMLPAQGLSGPRVFECGLPAPATVVSAEPPDAAALATVVCVGSFEPRKNQIAVLHAAELLWRDGLQFELVLIGGGGSSAELKRRVAQLVHRGRRVRTRTGITEADLAQAYREARFTVFPSLHEGYGLPVVESLALGTPVLTTDYGSPAEIAEAGGTLLVNPRDDRALAGGMRTLLTNDAVLAKLTEEIALRPARSWNDYADELWSTLIEPARASASAAAQATLRPVAAQPGAAQSGAAQPATESGVAAC